MAKRTLIMCLTVTALTLFLGVAIAQGYSFGVYNNMDQPIKKLEASEDGKSWGFFDIGSGIPSGATVTLTWDESTNGGNCSQYFRVTWEGGDQSEPVEFDFCEPGLVLEFD